MVILSLVASIYPIWILQLNDESNKEYKTYAVNLVLDKSIVFRVSTKSLLLDDEEEELLDVFSNKYPYGFRHSPNDLDASIAHILFVKHFFLSNLENFIKFYVHLMASILHMVTVFEFFLNVTQHNLLTVFFMLSLSYLTILVLLSVYWLN